MTDKDIKATSKFKSFTVASFKNVLLGKYLSEKYQELTGQYILFSVEDEPFDVNDFKGHISTPNYVPFKNTVDLLVAETVKYNPNYVVVEFVDGAIWFYYN